MNGTQEPRFRFLLVEDNIADARYIEELLTEADNGAYRIQCARSLASAIDMLSRSEAFDAALVDLNLPDSSGLETYLRIQRQAPRMPIVIVSGMQNHALAVAAMEQGAQEFLCKSNLITMDIIRALNRGMARTVPETGSAGGAKIIGVMGVKGGVGTTTLACHYAAELSRQSGHRLLLMETDLHSVGIGLLFDVYWRHTLLDLIKTFYRMDEALWRDMVYHCSENLDLVRTPGTAGSVRQPGRLREILRYAATLYGYILLDLGRLSESAEELLPELDDLLLVTTPDGPGSFNARRCIANLKDLKIPEDRFHLVVNRAGKKAQLSIGEVEAAVACPVYGFITDEPDDMASAITKPFLDQESRIRKQIADLAGLKLGRKPAPNKQPKLHFAGFSQFVMRYAERAPGLAEMHRG